MGNAPGISLAGLLRSQRSLLSMAVHSAPPFLIVLVLLGIQPNSVLAANDYAGRPFVTNPAPQLTFSTRTAPNLTGIDYAFSEQTARGVALFSRFPTFNLRDRHVHVDGPWYDTMSANGHFTHGVTTIEALPNFRLPSAGAASVANLSYTSKWSLITDPQWWSYAGVLANELSAANPSDPRISALRQLADNHTMVSDENAYTELGRKYWFSERGTTDNNQQGVRFPSIDIELTGGFENQRNCFGWIYKGMAQTAASNGVSIAPITYAQYTYQVSIDEPSMRQGGTGDPDYLSPFWDFLSAPDPTVQACEDYSGILSMDGYLQAIWGYEPFYKRNANGSLILTNGVPTYNDISTTKVYGVDLTLEPNEASQTLHDMYRQSTRMYLMHHRMAGQYPSNSTLRRSYLQKARIGAWSRFTNEGVMGIQQNDRPLPGWQIEMLIGMYLFTADDIVMWSSDFNTTPGALGADYTSAWQYNAHGVAEYFVKAMHRYSAMDTIHTGAFEWCWFNLPTINKNETDGDRYYQKPIAFGKIRTYNSQPWMEMFVAWPALDSQSTQMKVWIDKAGVKSGAYTIALTNGRSYFYDAWQLPAQFAGAQGQDVWMQFTDPLGVVRSWRGDYRQTIPGSVTVPPDFNSSGTNTAPAITHTPLASIQETTAPWAVSITAVDDSQITSAQLIWSQNGGAVSNTTMTTGGGGIYSGTIVPVSYADHDQFQYRTEVTDDKGLKSTNGPYGFMYSYPHTAPLIRGGSAWRYLSTNTAPSASWYTTSYVDSAWATGGAPLGYGTDSNFVTVVSYGPQSTNKWPTCYFRKTFSVTQALNIVGMKLFCQIDDGMVVYLNGQEVARTNMGTGAIAYTNWALANGPNPPRAWLGFEISPTLLVEGQNTLAVEVHQSGPSSSDIYMDLQLEATASAASQQFTSYNDVGWSSGQLSANITTLSPTGTTSGALHDFANGSVLGVQASITCDNPSSFFNNPANLTGNTPAELLFTGKVSLDGYATWGMGTVTITLSNLDPTRMYSFALFGDRGSSAYTYRWCDVRITDVTGFTNNSSSGTTISTVSMAGDQGRILAANTEGRVWRYDHIQSGPDGDVTFLVTAGGSTSTGGYLNAFMLQSDTGTNGPPLPPPAPTNWTVYNDCAWTDLNSTGTNADRVASGFTTNGPLRASGGGLVTTNGTTSVLVSFITNTATTISFLDRQFSLPSGTPLEQVFAGHFGTNNAINWTKGAITMTLSGLNTSKQYSVVIWSSRGGTSASYSNRWTDITLKSVDSFANNSSVGLTKFQTAAAQDSTRVVAVIDGGRIARYDQVRSGADGLITLDLVANGQSGTTETNGYLNAFMIQEEDVSASTDTDSDGMADTWEQAFFGGTSQANGGAAQDWDHDGFDNYSEYKAGTDPTSASSRLLVATAAATNGSFVVVTWPSASNRLYDIQQSTNIRSPWSILVSGIPATPPSNTQTASVGQLRGFIRVKVE